MTRKALYRDPRQRRLSGVCAGLANYFGWEVWLVRMIVLSATLLGGGFLIILAYVALSLMLENQPDDAQVVQQHKLKNRPWEQGKSASQLIQYLDQEVMMLEHKICRVEAYVTSESFRVNKAFQDL